MPTASPIGCAVKPIAWRAPPSSMQRRRRCRGSLRASPSNTRCAAASTRRCRRRGKRHGRSVSPLVRPARCWRGSTGTKRWWSSLTSSRPRGLESRTLDARRAKLIAELSPAKAHTARAKKARGLSDVLDVAESAVARESAMERQHEELSDQTLLLASELEVRQQELGRKEAALTAWRTAWGDGMDHLGLARDAGVGEADTTLGLLRELFDKVRDARTIEKRIEGIRRDAEELEDVARPLLNRFAADDAQLLLGDAVASLLARVRRLPPGTRATRRARHGDGAVERVAGGGRATARRCPCRAGTVGPGSRRARRRGARGGRASCRDRRCPR